MKNKSKIIPYIVLAMIVGTASCAPPTLEQQNQQKLINEVRNNTLSIPTISTGAVSGTVTFLNRSTINTNDIKIKITRQIDIPKLNGQGKPVDTTGKEFIDSKTQTQAFVEKKGDSIAIESLNGRNNFLIANLKPGDIAINVSSGSEQFDTVARIEAGKVIEVPEIILGSLNKTTIKTGVNIKGRVLRPDGTPVANSRVSDVSQGAATNTVTTNAQGEFVMQVNSFTKPKNLEASLEGLTTSIVVNPDQTEDLIISLVANSRTVKGRIIDSVNKNPIPNMTVRSVENNTSTSTDNNGDFVLRGVSTTAGTLEFGPLNGYVLKQEQIAQSSTNETILGNLDITPLGNVLINIVADNFPDPINFPLSQRAAIRQPGSIVGPTYSVSVDSISSVILECGRGATPPVYYVSNPFFYKEPITGTVQIEGTNITQQFTYPVTPTFDPPPKCVSGTGDNAESYTLTVYGNNQLLSIPVNNLPGGEYTISVSLSFHETQKGIKVVVPSRDTISTELIQMRRVKRILSVGDIVGKVVIKNKNNTNVNSAVKVRVLALRGEVDLRDPTLLNRIFSNPQGEIINSTTGESNTSGAVSSFGDFNIGANSSSGDYVLKNVPTGTRVIVAGVIDDNGVLNESYLISTYSSLNVVGSRVNQAPDNIITTRF